MALVTSPVDLGDVGLGHLVRRVRQPLGEVAVVGQDQQAVGVGVEPADVEEPLGRAATGTATSRSAGCAGPPGPTSSRPRRAACSAPGRRAARRRQPLAVDPDHGRGRVDLGAEPGDHLAVDLDPALASAPRSGAGRPRRLGEQLLQPDAVGSSASSAWRHSLSGRARSRRVPRLIGLHGAADAPASWLSSSSRSSMSGRYGASSGSSSRLRTPIRSRK